MVSPFVNCRGIRYILYLMEHQLNLNNPYEFYSSPLHVSQQTRCGRSILTAQLSQCEPQLLLSLLQNPFLPCSPLSYVSSYQLLL